MEEVVSLYEQNVDQRYHCFKEFVDFAKGSIALESFCEYLKQEGCVKIDERFVTIIKYCREIKKRNQFCIGKLVNIKEGTITHSVGFEVIINIFIFLVIFNFHILKGFRCLRM